MIMFVTSYDLATQPNLAVAKLLTGSSHQIFECNATREVLWAALGQTDGTTLFAMSHGRRQFIRAQGGVFPHAVDMEDTVNLGKRRIFAWACLTSAELGRSAASAGAIWFGFPVRIAAPPDHPRLQMFLARILQVAIDGLDSVCNESSCRSLLDQLVQCADNVLSEIDSLRSTNELQESDIDSCVQQCFEQFQLRLEAWLPGHDEPIRPTHAPQKRYDDLDPIRDLAGFRVE